MCEVVEEKVKKPDLANGLIDTAGIDEDEILIV